MENDLFVNKAFTHAINEYQDNKSNPEGVKFNSFYSVIIRTLTFIYDELDIINPYNFKDENSLNNNLIKYGYPLASVNEFKDALEKFYENENSDGFVFIEKSLIDMFIKKNLSQNLTDEEIDEFKKIIYSPYSDNPLIVSYNFLMANEPNEIMDYFIKSMKENVKKVITKPKETLNLEAYEILKYSLDDIKAMSGEQLDDVNKKVYEYFGVNANAINKDYLLDKAVYDYTHPKPALSTGNGYVDILFILSIIATLTMIIVVVSVIFL